MADKKISQLNAATTIFDADDFAVVQDGETKQTNASVVKTYVKDGLSKSDVGLGNVDNTSDATKNSATVTLTNKTISGSNNTLSNIGNSSLTNSSITINGNAVSLGGSTTVTATASNALTLGTGLTGTSYNGSTAVTAAIDTGVVTTLTGTQTLTNKTISGSSNTLSNIGNSSLTNSAITFGATSQALGSTVSALNAVSIGGTTAAAGAFTTLSASSTVSGTGFSNYLASPPAIGGSSPAAGAFTTLSSSSTTTVGTNLVFSGTGNRITGDFSNATVANRVAFQTSTANSATSVSAIPSGTNTQSDFFAFNAADPTNASHLLIRAGTAEASVRSGITGTGTYLPLTFYTGGSERVRIDTSGNVGIGASVNNVFDGTAAARPLLVQSASSATVVSTSTNALVICNSDTTANNLSQINFAAITGASTNQYSSALISVIHGARVNGQYPTGQMVFSTSSATNSGPTEKMRIANTGIVTIGNPSTPAISLDPTTANALVVNSSGNVGIGTTNAYSRATVYNASSNYPLFLRGGSAGVGGDGGGIAFSTAASSTITSPTAAAAAIRSLNTYGSESNGEEGDLAFYTNRRTGANTYTGLLERLRITSAGDLLVGTTSATSQFFKVQAASNVCLGLQSATVTSGAITLNAINDANTVNIPLDIRCSQFHITSGVTAGAGTATLKFQASGAVTYDTSSARYKHNIRDSIYGLADVLALRSVMFEYNADGRTDVGVIAEDVLPVIPELVSLNQDGLPESVAYDRFISVLIKAVQELSAKVTILEAKVN